MLVLLSLLAVAQIGLSASIEGLAPPIKDVGPKPSLPANCPRPAYYAIDFSQPATNAQMQCLAQAGYSAAIVRAYTPTGNGAYDPYACTNIHNAYPCIGTDVFMTPQPFSTKPGYTQFDEMYSGLRNNGIMLTSAWLQVVSPSHWSGNIQSNINFINSVLNRMRQYTVRPGIYTSQSDWYQITGNWIGAGTDCMLWYISVRGPGLAGESPANFDDFVPFGNWQCPTMKQFGQVESLCGLTVNRDIFVPPTQSFAAFLEGLKGLDKNIKPEVYPVGIFTH